MLQYKKKNLILFFKDVIIFIYIIFEVKCNLDMVL